MNRVCLQDYSTEELIVELVRRYDAGWAVSVRIDVDDTPARVVDIYTSVDSGRRYLGVGVNVGDAFGEVM